MAPILASRCFKVGVKIKRSYLLLHLRLVIDENNLFYNGFLARRHAVDEALHALNAFNTHTHRQPSNDELEEVGAQADEGEGGAENADRVHNSSINDNNSSVVATTSTTSEHLHLAPSPPPPRLARQTAAGGERRPREAARADGRGAQLARGNEQAVAAQSDHLIIFEWPQGRSSTAQAINGARNA
jgi:hypothetical protein